MFQDLMVVYLVDKLCRQETWDSLVRLPCQASPVPLLGLASLLPEAQGSLPHLVRTHLPPDNPG